MNNINLPKDAEYGMTANFSFSNALWHLKSGKKVARTGWNGKGMWLFLSHCEPDSINTRGLDLELNPCIVMVTADRKIQPGWLASQTDLLANDWELVED